MPSRPMELALSYLRLFRWPNLLVIGITQYLMRHAVILPAFASHGAMSGISHVDFAMLVLATTGLSAAGYAINDYFDVAIDRVNKPERLILGKTLDRRAAIGSHKLLNLASVGIGIYLSCRYQYWPLALIFFLSPALLWYYSIRLKRHFLTGNLMVSMLTALSVLMVWMVEHHVLQHGKRMPPTLSGGLTELALFYGLFAFLLSLVREVLKDMEDAIGDRCAGCRTLPIVLGARRTKIVVVTLLLLAVAGIAWSQFTLFSPGQLHVVVYLLLLVQLPVLALLPALLNEHRAEGFGRLQKMLKLIMLTGVLSMGLLVNYFS